MKAILVLPSAIPALCGLDERTPSALLPLGDRPFLQHIVEHLSAGGVRDYHFVVGHLPEQVERYFGDGTRWGCHFRYHLSNAAEHPYRSIQVLCESLDDAVLLGHSDYFPLTALDCGVAFETESGDWSGCAIFESNALKPEWLTGDRAFLEGCLRRDAALHWRLASKAISLRTGLDLLASQQALLTGTLPSLMIGGGSAEPGIWIARNVTIHPSARITAPVYLGENCRVERGTEIGPQAVLSRNCIVDQHSSIRDSLVMRGSYIGEGLELDQAIVDRNLLVNARLETGVFISERFLLGGLTDRSQRSPIRKILSALLAAALLVILLPFFLIVLAARMAAGTARVRLVRIVELPANADAQLWTTYSLYRVVSNALPSCSPRSRLFREIVPGLIAVCRGKLALVGLQPRTPEEVLALPADWQKLYLAGVSGLITEAAVTLDSDASDEEFYLAEACYSALRSWRRDIDLFCRFWAKLVSLTPPHPPAAGQEQN